VVADRAGFERFYRDNLARIVRACYLVVLDRTMAEEVAADAFTRLWSKWDQIRDDDHAGGYVFKTAMRLCARRKRSIRRERDVRSIAIEDQAGGRAESLAVWEALAELPIRQRQAVVLRDWAGYETAEVAGILEIRESTVRVHLARGRATLRHILALEERTT
jgi:RNA polymerase sigma factor (sigma-70 family)